MTGTAGGLTGRHIRFIAIGGAIGAGLFLGSGAGIRVVGPGLILAYALCGVMVFLIARALGELSLFQPVSGSFATYAETYLGRTAGFVTGWSYWLVWVLVGIAELTAVGMFTRFWLPSVPQWLPALIALVALYTLNRVSVRLFGEIEFWLSIVKVVTILGLIAMGVVMLLIGHDAAGDPVRVSTIWSHGGMLPGGIGALATALPLALFAFGGIEMIGLAAREAEDPEKSLPAAINGVIIRILVFYIGSLAVIMALFPWNSLAAGESPFVMVFTRVGLPAAANLVNAVVISAVISSCNSGIFATGRIGFSLAEAGHSPSCFARMDKRGLPSRAMTLAAGAMLVGVAMNYVVPDQVLGFIMAGVAGLLLWIWLIIMVCHLAYKREVDAGRATAPAFRLPGAPYTNYLVIAFLLGMAVLMLANANSRVSLISALIWLVGLAAIDILRRVARR